jgi:tetratricopeptide (TPR) repeat protein
LQGQATKAQLEISETLFTITAALNTCGYDAGLQDSLPVRAVVRSEIAEAAQKSAVAAQARAEICKFREEHQPEGTAGDVTQYISLALELGPPPDFKPQLPEADLPPDAAHVLGIIPLLGKFYQAAGIHGIWQKHVAQYESLVAQFHDPVADIIHQTDLYLKLPFSNYPGQHVAVFLEPMLAPSHVDSRNYGSAYFVVISPGKDGLTQMPAVRHTYLHFVLDPMALRYGASLKRIEPLLLEVRTAPMADAFKNDVTLMVNESLIRAIEARVAIPKSNEAARNVYVQHSVEEGFILSRYFYEALANFEKESVGLKDAYGADLLYHVDLDREKKRARDTIFATQASPEVISSSKAWSATSQLDTAEQKLGLGDLPGAQKIAEQVIQHNNGGDDPGRATFILARIATLSGRMEEARLGFQQTVQSVHDPRLLAWSHIYLGRIFDLQEQREAAVAEYRAALQSGDPTPDTKLAAERGLATPYQPRSPR